MIWGGAKASKADKPLHMLVFTVPIPAGKETLNSKRENLTRRYIRGITHNLFLEQVCLIVPDERFLNILLHAFWRVWKIVFST